LSTYNEMQLSSFVDQAGDRRGAIRKYRELTGFGVDQAQEAIAKI
jgi:hypothetical protein